MVELPVYLVIGVVSGVVIGAIYTLTTKKCPGCRKRVGKSAAVCKFCHRSFEGQAPG